MDTGLHRHLTHCPSPLLELRGWRYRGAPHWCDRGAHRSLEITWVNSGQVSYRLGREELTLEPGAVFLVPPEVEHATGFLDAGAAVDAGAVHLDPGLLAGVAQVLGTAARRPRPGPLAGARRIIAAGRLLLERADERGPGAQLAAEALAEVLAVEVLRSGPAGPEPAAATDPRISAALEQIEACYAEPLSVEDLARTAGMSRFHFSRRFREVTGQSPYRYLIETRLRRAAALLRRGHHSVTEAALSAGFADLGRFSRMFREWAGTPPHRYGEAARSAHSSTQSA